MLDIGGEKLLIASGQNLSFADEKHQAGACGLYFLLYLKLYRSIEYVNNDLLGSRGN